jgi:D-cysteine desulfhydrase
VLEERVAGTYDPKASGNNFLFGLMGVEQVTVVPAGSDLMAAMQILAADLPDSGRKGYLIPGGGSNALGALGYVACADEILAQTFDMGLALDHVVTPSGSAGTHAGLLVGLVGRNAAIPLTGINVSRPRALQETNVHTLALATAEKLDLSPIPREAVTALGDWVGPGYSLPTPEMIEAVHILARLEGVLLDPVYTGKAMAGLIGLVRAGHFKTSDNVLFVHTGGSPALFAYQDVLRD